ncbi:MAG: hypothetical protein ACD_4C00247G0001, partial [uncultured bacterium (gcode 4)]
MKKKIVAFIVSTVLLVSFSTTSFAVTDNNIDSTEVINIDGNQVEISYFTQNGVKYEAMKIRNEKVNRSVKSELDTLKTSNNKLEILNKAEK